MAAAAVRVIAVSVALALAVLGCVLDRKVKGQVFIVTQSRLNVTMGLVTVRVYREEDVLKSLSRYRERVSAFKESMQPALNAASRRVAEAESLEVVAGHKYKVSPSALEDAYFKKEITSEQFNEAISGSHPEADLRLQTAKREAELAKKDREAVLDRIRAIQTEDSTFAALPPPVGLTQTDANGDFELDVPAVGTYMVGAQASRQVVGSSEHYAWLVKVPEAALHGKKFLLSNDNLLGPAP